MYARYAAILTGDLDVWPFELNIGTQLTRALENVYINFDFSFFFLFSYGTDGRTGGKTRNGAYTSDA